MRLTHLRHWLTPLCLLPVACSSATDEYRPITSTPEDYCQRRCNRAHACTDSINPAECRSSCQSTLATQPELRADLLGYVVGCVEGSSCGNTVTSKCKNEALAQLSVSEYGKGVCAAYVVAGKQCDDMGANYPESACLEAAKTYDDSALKAANDCFTRSCAELAGCLAQTMPQASLSP